MSDKIFVDTNIVVYALDKTQAQHTIAIDFLSRRPVISVQVVNETTAVQVRKLKRSLAAAHEVATWLLDTCEVVEQSPADVRQAIELCRQFDLSHWDALILASAMRAGCERVYSEDMQHGLWVSSSLQILNPFTN